MADVTKRIICSNADGECCITEPSDTTTKTLEQIAVQVCGSYPYTIVDKSTIPTDRSFRDAWTFTP